HYSNPKKLDLPLTKNNLHRKEKPRPPPDKFQKLIDAYFSRFLHFYVKSPEDPPHIQHIARHLDTLSPHLKKVALHTLKKTNTLLYFSSRN
ncbi:hypothetical protein, partial [Pseudomonas protegens]|uniref:hypothetical protein n=1 Tax=Pseudomonas protegens TaxID=380021 RepID=UPI001B33CAE8